MDERGERSARPTVIRRTPVGRFRPSPRPSSTRARSPVRDRESSPSRAHSLTVRALFFLLPGKGRKTMRQGRGSHRFETATLVALALGAFGPRVAFAQSRPQTPAPVRYSPGVLISGSPEFQQRVRADL